MVIVNITKLVALSQSFILKKQVVGHVDDIVFVRPYFFNEGAA